MVGQLDDIREVSNCDLETVLDAGLRHQSGSKPADYLRHFLHISRQFAYATQDDSWGEFEKHFTIIMRNYVRMERELDRLNHA